VRDLREVASRTLRRAVEGPPSVARAEARRVEPRHSKLMNRTNYEDDVQSGQHDRSPSASHVVLPPALPAVREWNGALFGLAGVGCLAACATLVLERLGHTSSIAPVAQMADLVTASGATPALLAIGGTVLVGLWAGARGRRRQAQRVLHALGQMPDHGAWLEDLDASLQRLHVSLVTVESRLSSMIEQTANVLEERLARPVHTPSNEIAELDARLIRVGATVDHLSAGVARMEERSQIRTSDPRMPELLERVARLTARIESLRMPSTTTYEHGSDEPHHNGHDLHDGNDQLDVQDGIEIVDLSTDDQPRRELPSVDTIAAPIPRGNVVTVDLDAEDAVDGLPLFAGMDEPTRAQVPAPKSRRNPYDG